MLGAIGDLVEDVVVQLREPVNLASDTAARIVRRRGGSAANVVAAACIAGGAARFIGQVGDDEAGRNLTDALAAVGAEVTVRRAGRTGTVIALLDVAGERTMLTDRGACSELADPQPAWLDGLDTLHIPFYSLIGDPLATTTATLAAWASTRNITISVDASSSSVLEHVGPAAAIKIIRSLAPAVVLANELEAATLGAALNPDNLNGAIVVVRQGALPAIVLRSGQQPTEVAAKPLQHVSDTTGAGDAFAAGFLLAFALNPDPIAAVRRGHQVAAEAIQRASA